MRICVLGDGDVGLTGQQEQGEEEVEESGGGEVVRLKAKHALVGAGARVLFYPTLLYNVLRNRFESDFRWWDRVDKFILLGAVPFPSDVLRLKQLGVQGVVTLNEPYETLVPTSLYQIKYRSMTPEAALDHVRSIRPRVLLAPSQWQAVSTFGTLVTGQLPVRSTNLGSFLEAIEACRMNTESNDYHAMEFDYEDGGLPLTQIMLPRPTSPTGYIDAVLITEADLEGYDTYVDARKDALEVAAPRPIMRRLSCLFGSLKLNSSNCEPAPSRFTEVRAC
nr:unnamed protein product [Digitaria exilis]